MMLNPTNPPPPTAPLLLSEEEQSSDCQRERWRDDCDSRQHTQHNTSLAARAAASIRVQTIECITATVVIAMIILASTWSYFHCFWCLAGIAAVCLCLCPFIHFYNFPLWLALVLLAVSLWGYLSAGEMQLGPFLLHWSRVQQQ